MSAFDDFVETIQGNKQILATYRKELISGRGSLVNGEIPQGMDLKIKEETLTELDENNNPIIEKQVRRLYIHAPGVRGEDYGFILNREGTERAIDTVMSGSKLRIYDDYANSFLFYDDEKNQIWNETSRLRQRRLVADDIEKMVKKTNLQYRTHGDRLHYFILGKVTTTSSSFTGAATEVKTYPLLLFSCIDTDKMKLTVEVETSGFVNFWLDENLLNGVLSKRFGGVEVSLNHNLISEMAGLQQELTKLQFNQFDEVKLDPTFSMIGIITGFEAEYIDKAWGAIINDKH